MPQNVRLGLCRGRGARPSSALAPGTGAGKEEVREVPSSRLRALPEEVAPRAGSRGGDKTAPVECIGSF